MGWLIPILLFLHLVGVMIGLGPTFVFERIVSTGAKDPTHARFASLLVKSISSEWSWPLATLQSERGCIRDSHEW